MNMLVASYQDLSLVLVDSAMATLLYTLPHLNVAVCLVNIRHCLLPITFLPIEKGFCI